MVSTFELKVKAFHTGGVSVFHHVMSSDINTRDKAEVFLNQFKAGVKNDIKNGKPGVIVLNDKEHGEVMLNVQNFLGFSITLNQHNKY